MKLYLAGPMTGIAGPMTGIADHNFPAFNQEAARLREAGYGVINPAENFNGRLDAGDWAFYLRHDLKLMLDCDALALLPGYERSRGARLETYVASQLGIPFKRSREYT